MEEDNDDEQTPSQSTQSTYSTRFVRIKTCFSSSSSSSTPPLRFWAGNLKKRANQFFDCWTGDRPCHRLIQNIDPNDRNTLPSVSTITFRTDSVHVPASLLFALVRDYDSDSIWVEASNVCML